MADKIQSKIQYFCVALFCLKFLINPESNLRFSFQQ